MPKTAMSLDQLSGIASVTKAAIDFKFMQAPLTDAQLAELIQIPR
jgi:hypothetical protein